MTVTGSRGRRLAAAAAVAALLVGAAVAVLVHRHELGGTANGTVLVVDGRTYWVSGERVAAPALGALVARDVPFQDTRADVREVRGYRPEAVLAAWLPAQRAGQSGPGWTFVAVDERLGTDPRSDPGTASVLAP